MKKIALFDICDTILPFNSTYKFIEFLYPQKKLPQNYLTMKLLNKIIYKITTQDLIRKYNLHLLKYHSKLELDSRAHEFIESVKLNKLIIERIEILKNKGYDVYLLSATIEPVALQLSIHLNLNGYFSSILEFDDKGICLGRIQHDLLSNKTKTIKDIKGTYDYIVFFTDNKSDENCISECDEFIAVIPKNKKNNIQYWDRKKIKDIINL